MQDLQFEITKFTRVRRILDVLGIIAGLTALLFPSLSRFIFSPQDNLNFQAILIWNVSMGLLPIAFNLMVLSIALRLRARELARVLKAEPEQATTLIEAYLAKIDRHRIVLLTIGWLSVAKAVTEIVLPIMSIFGNLARFGDFATTVWLSLGVQMSVTVFQGLVFAAAQFGLARLLKNQRLRLSAQSPKLQEISPN